MNTHTNPFRVSRSAMRSSAAWLLMAALALQAVPQIAVARLAGAATPLVITEAFQVIDDSDSVGNPTLKFGEGLAKTLTYNRTTGQFEFNDDLEVAGTISGSLVTQVGAGNNYFMGNVGIGTASPGSKIDVNGSIRVTNLSSVSAGAGVEISYISAQTRGIISAYDNDATAYKRLDIQSSTLVLNGDGLKGNVGVGVASPGATLSVSGSVLVANNFPAVPSRTAKTQLEVDGTMSGNALFVSRSLSGAGLVSCSNTTTSKLLWNSTTGRFSCGTDQTGASPGNWSNTGSLQTAFDNRYVNTSGDTMTGKLTINLSSGFLGLNILQMLSGAIVHAEKTLTSSGTVLAVGNLTTRGTASGKNLTFMGASNSYIVGSLGVGTTSPETKLEVVGTISGSALQTMGNLSVSGSVLTELNTGGGVLYSNTGTLATTAKGSSGQVLVAQGTAAPAFKNPTGSMVWYLDGTITVGTGQGAAVTMPFGMTATSVHLRLNGAPTGQALIVDIKKDGTTIFSTKPQIYKGYTSGGTGAVLSVTNIPSAAVMTMDVTQVGSTFAGSGLTVQLNGIRKY